jgi:GNAT superfamily N-acetyltransferase
MKPTTKDWMKKLQSLDAPRREEREKLAAAHRPFRDEKGLIRVRFEPDSVTPTTLERVHLVRIYSPDDQQQNFVEVGGLYLTPKSAELLHLDKISIQGLFDGRGYGSAAMRHLIELADAAGYHAIEGEISGHPDDWPKLRHFYRKAGFIVDYDGVDDRIWFALPSAPATAPKVEEMP